MIEVAQQIHALRNLKSARDEKTNLQRELHDLMVMTMETPESLRTRKDGPVRDMFARAIARGELRPNVDPELLKAVLMGAVHNRLFILNQPLEDLFLTRLVDLVLEGVAPRERTHSSRAK